ncbi:formin [Trypanosoma grayi]|uniref:formin n=1 Tax=Trypanosoma grayi TaxID=71804 RepID=UPI0004F46CED|nr:formin [Trypanosoma grayi]KEG07310.1 formin [Trypanosoma grayi]
MNALWNVFGSSERVNLKQLFDYPVFIWQIPCGSSSFDKKGGLSLSKSSARNVRATCRFLDDTYSHRYMIFNFSPLMVDLEESCRFGELMDYSKQPIEDFRLLIELCFTIMKWTLAGDEFTEENIHCAVLVFLEESPSIPYPNYAAMIATCYHIFNGCQSSGGRYTLEFVEGQLGIHRSRIHAASQECYVNYFQLLLDIPMLPSTRRRRLVRVSLHNMDSLKGMHLGLRVESEGKIMLFSDPTAWEEGSHATAQLLLNPQVSLFGDFAISVLQYELPVPPPPGQPEPPRPVHVLARCAFSTIFIHKETHHARARDMDYAAQSNLPGDSYILLHFEEVRPEVADGAYIEQLTQRIDQTPRHQMFLQWPWHLSAPDRHRDRSCFRGGSVEPSPSRRLPAFVSLQGEEERRYQDDDELASSLDLSPQARYHDPSPSPPNEPLSPPTPSVAGAPRLSKSERRRQRRRRRQQKRDLQSSPGISTDTIATSFPSRERVRASASLNVAW